MAKKIFIPYTLSFEPYNLIIPTIDLLYKRLGWNERDIIVTEESDAYKNCKIPIGHRSHMCEKARYVHLNDLWNDNGKPTKRELEIYSAIQVLKKNFDLKGAYDS